MYSIKRTHSQDPDFRKLVQGLNEDLAIRNGEANDFFMQFNGLDGLDCVVVAYEADVAVGCGAAKQFDAATREIKRMFVLPTQRGRGIAGQILAELERWCREQNYQKCVLETGQKQPEAVRLYLKSGYQIVPNFEPYTDVADSICFEKALHETSRPASQS